MARIELKNAEEKKVKHFDITSIVPLSSRIHANGEIIIIQLGELQVHAFRSINSGDYGRYLPCKIEKERVVVWEFSEEVQEGIKKGAFLLSHDEGFHLIGVVSGSKLLKIVLLGDLEKCQVVKTTSGRQIIGGSSVSKILKLKKEVATSLRFDCVMTAAEEKISEMEAKAQAAIALQKCAELEAEGAILKAAQAAEKERRLQEILGREKILVYRENGQRIMGIPVADSEWQCLPNGTGVVLVAEYNSGEVNGVSEAFYVEKKGSTVKKRNCCAVTETLPKKSDEVAPVEMTRRLFQFGDEIDEFPLVTGETLQQLREQKVNSGAMFAVSFKGQSPVMVKLMGKEVVHLPGKPILLA